MGVSELDKLREFPDKLDLEWQYLGITGFEYAKEAQELAWSVVIEMRNKWIDMVNCHIIDAKSMIEHNTNNAV